MFIALDIGGTHTRIASFSSIESPTRLQYKKVATNHDYKKGFSEIVSTINGFSRGEEIKGIGAAMALPLKENNAVAFNVNLAGYGWDAKTLEKDLVDTFKTKVNIINDASAGALGETIFGNHEFTEFIFIAWGTGVGGVYINRENGIFNIHEFEPGHLEIIKGGRKCVCGKKGCFQAYAGGKSLEDLYKKKLTEFTETEWASVLEVFRIGIKEVLKKHNSGHIIINGKVILEHPEFLNQLRIDINNESPFWINTEKSYIGDEGPLYGALMSLAEYLDLSLHKEF